MKQSIPTEEYCAKSERVDGKLHSWHFDGDDPYVICYYCDEKRDAISNRKIETGDLGDLQMPSMTTRQFAEYTKKVEHETFGLVISKLEEILESKTTPELITAIVEDLKEAVYD